MKTIQANFSLAILGIDLIHVENVLGVLLSS